MSENSFDKYIKEKISSWIKSYNPDSWERLKSKLNTMDNDDAIFDSIIADKFKEASHSVPPGAFIKFENHISSIPNNTNIENPNYLLFERAIASIILLLYFIVPLTKEINSNNTSQNLISTDIALNQQIKSSEKILI
ncbi:MAG: hypothetical protein R2771_16090 [Saprospiraceae bacterium]